MGGQSVEDMERVIAAMRRVVERLQGENDQLKKSVGAGGPQYGEVIKENKRLKVKALPCWVFCVFMNDVVNRLLIPMPCGKFSKLAIKYKHCTKGGRKSLLNFYGFHFSLFG